MTIYNKIFDLPHPIVLFDGVCNLCTGSAQFLSKRDKSAQIRFTSLQSDFGQKILQGFGLPLQDFKSFVFLEKGQLYVRSSAFLKATRYLKGLWPWLYGLMLVPVFIRDGVYNFIAKRRYRWFGKREECWIPTPEIKSRFIE